MYVILEHSPNPDIRGGYWVTPLYGKRKVQIDSYKEASDVCRRYIEDNELGAGNWGRDAGDVYSDYGVYLARVSYNGRVWDLKDKEIKI